MRILHVTNMYPEKDSPLRGIFIKEQIDSLTEQGVENQVYYLKGHKGFFYYFSGIRRINELIRSSSFDCIHVHFGYTGLSVLLSKWLFRIKLPVIITFCGSDILAQAGIYGIRKKVLAQICRFSARFFEAAIVVSREMKKLLPGRVKVHVIPRGVDTSFFRSISKKQARKKLKLDPHKKIILFGGDPANKVKNFPLAQKAFLKLKEKYPDLELKVLRGCRRKDVPLLMNAADVMLLLSFWEGSPNVIKEAMACNLPVVATDTGDIRYNMKGLKGTFITGYDADDATEKIETALQFNKKTKGREQLFKRGLDRVSAAQRILSVYQGLLKKSIGNY